eukprot:109787-Pelagomonas_calceolata.AAC.1
MLMPVSRCHSMPWLGGSSSEICACSMSTIHFSNELWFCFDGFAFPKHPVPRRMQPGDLHTQLFFLLQSRDRCAACFWCALWLRRPAQRRAQKATARLIVNRLPALMSFFKRHKAASRMLPAQCSEGALMYQTFKCAVVCGCRNSQSYGAKAPA